MQFSDLMKKKHGQRLQLGGAGKGHNQVSSPTQANKSKGVQEGSEKQSPSKVQMKQPK